ncbi:hypothetical protein HU200_021210 [Digitaria exilis]|uniref:Uncharacterized protein n=1 Tax=Digitaria exilis TaxID=1010633 RepID=A0A835F001_9POAL|nr:hypothetical protein HU200_021210 [Digitaria exilis]
MERKFYEKYTALKKRKLLDEGLERKREAELKELLDGKDRPLNLGGIMRGRVLGEERMFLILHFDFVFGFNDTAMKDWVSGLEKDKEELSEKLADKEDELEKTRQDFLADIRARDSEILRLKQLLDEKIEKNNSTATQSVKQTQVIQENPTRVSPRRKTPQSSSKAKRVLWSENTAISQEQECSRRHTCLTGNGTNECPSAHMFHLLLQSLVRMKITVHDGTEGFLVSVSHEATGTYSC